MWIIVAIVFFVLEIATPSFFFMWFGLGALGALVSTFFYPHLWLSIVIFIATSATLVILSHPLAEKISGKQSRRAASDSLIGKRGVVIEEIDPLTNKGKVRVGSDVWRAVSLDKIKKDSFIKVEKIEGVHLVVKKEEEK